MAVRASATGERNVAKTLAQPAAAPAQQYARAAFRNRRNEARISMKLWSLERRGDIPEIGPDLRGKLAAATVKVFAEANDKDLDTMIDGARGADDGKNLFAERLNEKVGGTFLDLILQLLPLLLPLITCI